MRYVILTVGSRGDVQPFVALGLGLQAAGHDVVLATSASFRPLVEGHGLPFAPLDDAFIQMSQSQAFADTLDSGGRKVSLSMFREVMPLLRRILDDEWTVAQGAEAIIYHPKALGGYHLAEKLGVPVIQAFALPDAPTSAFPNPILPQGMPGFLNRLSYRVNDWGRAPFMGMINAWRREVLGLPPRSRFAGEQTDPTGRPMPRVYGYSPHVVPSPPDWPADTLASGYWFLDGAADWQPPAALLDFLEAGPPPVYIGFGSMRTGDPAQKARMVVEALGRANQRGLLASGWGALQSADLPPTVFPLDEAPHDWLFPRMAAVVHHGGAGTTAAGLRAGKPTFVLPFFGDQPFWGRRVHELGLGPEPVAQRKLTAENLTAGLRAVTGDAAMRERAAARGERIRAEDGVGTAVAFIEAVVAARLGRPIPAR